MLSCGALLAAGVAAFGVAPGVAQEIVCPSGEARSVVTELFLGRDGGGRRGAVTETRFSDFLAREITPRFPDGLTVIDAYGQWRDPATRRISREATKLVVLVTPAEGPAAPTRESRIAAIVDAYKHRFRQKSVLVLTRVSCARF